MSEQRHNTNLYYKVDTFPHEGSVFKRQPRRFGRTELNSTQPPPPQCCERRQPKRHQEYRSRLRDSCLLAVAAK